MRHLVSGRKLNRTSSHRKALLANLATELFRHKSIRTTEAKAKELRPYAESLITKAKNALIKEKSGQLAEGQSLDLHSRRVVARHIRVKEVLSELFDSIAPAVIDRNGGYSRIIKTGMRQGDSARMAIIELVDFSEPQDGAFALKKRSKKSTKKDKHVKKVEDQVELVEDTINETVENIETAEVEEVVEESAETSAEIVTETTEETASVAEETAETAEENISEDNSLEETSDKSSEADAEESQA